MKETSTSAVVSKNGKYYKLVPPDGGWGYVVAFAMVIIMTAMTAPMNCFGVIYGEFLKSHHISTSAVGLQSGVSVFTFSFSAFLANIALKRYSLRTVGLIGASLCCAGTFGAIFMDSYLELVVFGSLLTGGGGGLMMTCIFTAFNMYFKKKRVFTMSISQTIICILSIVSPMLISASMDEFGFRNTLVFLCGMTLQTLVAFLLVQPVQRHLLLREINPADHELHELEPLNPQDKKVHVINCSKQIDVEAIKKNKENIDVKENRTKMGMVADYLDLQLLQEPVFLNVCIGVSITLVSDITFIILLPLHLTQALWTSDEVAFLLTLLMVGDAAGRVALAALSGFFSVDSRLAFLAGVVGMTVIRFGMFSVNTVSTVTAVCTALGFFRCFVQVTYPLVIADHVMADQYPAAQGLQMLLTGLLSFFAGPAAGAVKDWTGSYEVAFHVLTGSALLACVVPWILEMAIVRRKRPALSK